MPGHEHEQDHELARQLADVARTLIAADDVERTLQRMVELAVKTIDGCEHASLSLVTKDGIETPAQTDPPVPQTIDRIQIETGEGPCLDAIRQHVVFETRDLSRETRWPNFSPAVVETTDVRSVLAIRLFVEEDTLGALNLYATAVDAFDDVDRSVASIFAAHAAVALHGAIRQEQLTEAIATRDVIGQAKGILMARRDVDEDIAFTLLREASNRMHRRLREVAQEIVDRDQRS